MPSLAGRPASMLRCVLHRCDQILYSVQRPGQWEQGLADSLVVRSYQTTCILEFDSCAASWQCLLVPDLQLMKMKST